MVNFGRADFQLIYPFTLSAAETGQTILDIFLVKASFEKHFQEGEVWIRTLSTTLLEIFCEFMLYLQVIFKSRKESDDIFPGNSEC